MSQNLISIFLMYASFISFLIKNQQIYQTLVMVVQSRLNDLSYRNYIYLLQEMSLLDLSGERNQAMTLITEVLSTQSKSIALSSKKYQVYMVEDSIPPVQFPNNQTFTPLPATVEFSRIVANVITSLSTSYFKQLQKQKDNGNQNTIEKWTKYLNLYQNKALVSDCFWFAICKFFHEGKYQYSQAELQKRIAKNYIGLFLSIPDKKQNDIFFKEFFNTLSQSVFYSFFYAFPKSRSKFDNKLKEQLLTTFSKIFTGVQISNKKYYFEKWTLDLGTGNILAKKPKKPQNSQQLQIPQSSDIILNPLKTKKFQKMKKRETLPIRYSPIVQLYLKTNKYKTRNYVSQFKMKYTQVDKNDHLKQEKFAYYKEQAKRIQQWSDAQKDQDDLKRKQLQSEIKALKRETINHHKRLDRRKAEELQRGAHEYANYLVSMLNAGITMTSLGVVRKNIG